MRAYFAILGLTALPASTTAMASMQDSVGSAITQPLRDTRLEKYKIPEALQLAASAPYSNANTGSCATILGEIDRLTAALGPDADASHHRQGEGATTAAVAARTAVNSLIPGLGIVRMITGADKEQRRAEAAVYAGSTRRAYLKGIGLMRRCSVPAAPTAAAVAEAPRLERER